MKHLRYPFFSAIVGAQGKYIPISTSPSTSPFLLYTHRRSAQKKTPVRRSTVSKLSTLRRAATISAVLCRVGTAPSDVMALIVIESKVRTATHLRFLAGMISGVTAT